MDYCLDVASVKPLSQHRETSKSLPSMMNFFLIHAYFFFLEYALSMNSVKTLVTRALPARLFPRAGAQGYRDTTDLPVKHRRREYEAPPPQVREQSLQSPHASQLPSLSSSE